MIKKQYQKKMSIGTPAPVNIDKALASGGLVMGSPKKPPFGKKIVDDLFGSPEKNKKQKEEGKKLNEKFSYGVQIKKSK